MRAILLVAAGGTIGAALRWGTAEVIDQPAGGFPWATLLVNVAGCLMIGLAARRLPRDSDAWRGLAVGGHGGLTTFSTFSVETQTLLDQGDVVTAGIYVGLTLIAGLGATEWALHRRGDQG